MSGVWIAGITVVVWPVTALFPDQPHDDPKQILEERLVRGEIDLDEYREGGDEPHTRTRPRPADRARG